MNRRHLKFLVLLAPLSGCVGGVSDFGSQPPPEVDDELPAPPNDPGTPPEVDPGDPPPPPPPPAGCDKGKSYVGFAGTVLEAGRVDAELGLDRLRVKPYTAFATEYNRALGNTPGLIASSASTFDSAPARWYVEPQSSAVSVFTAYRIGFQGCLTLTASPAKYASVPSNTTAATECTAWATKFWSRAPSQTEVDTCVKTAMVDTATQTDVRRRWAYTCASVLASAGFLTY